MARRLSAHERALWSRVAATIRPLGGRPPAEVPPAPAILPPAPAPAPPRRAAVAARTPAAAAKPEVEAVRQGRLILRGIGSDTLFDPFEAVVNYWDPEVSWRWCQAGQVAGQCVGM